ncbi:MAG: long-chain fatty acid--CoA ligase [Clostridiales Family XIII bacterium]|jgi:long-chain acyl-CoA synthetase|nr:long-chain fatty acid--CoA ligase [Clostridiales Family XIII bacterium]
MDFRFGTVGSIYKNHFRPDRPAVYFKETTYTYQELDDKVRAFANYLKAKGVAKGDKVILDAGNCPEFLFLYCGVGRNAAVVVPVNPMLTLPELTYIAGDSDAAWMIVQEGVMAKHGYTEEGLSEALGVRVLVLGEAMLAEAEAAPRDDFDLIESPDEISTFLYTSGTTGQPKAAMLSHHNLVVNAWQDSVMLQMYDDDVFLCVLPMFHVFAFTTSILIPLFRGASTDIVEAFQPKTVISELLAKKVNVFLGVPAMYMVLIEAGKNNIKFPDLRIAVSGGSALPVEIYRQTKELVGLPVIEGYGLTEASPACTFNPTFGVQKAGSIGVHIPEITVIVGGENDEELPVGEVGELLVRGENVMKGYYNRPEETAEALRGGWLHTGDLAKMDEDGYFFIVDRKKDIVVVAGLNVYPREVEEALYGHPQIKDAAVIGKPDALRGEALVAYVVPKEGEAPDTKEIIAWLKERLAAYKIPRRVELREELPRNSSGKILKRLLKEEA